MHFLLPDVFSSAADFLKWLGVLACSDRRFDFNNSSSESLKADIVNTLRKVVSPFFLRRVKSDIDIYLPRKVEVLVYTEMTSYEKELYWFERWCDLGMTLSARLMVATRSFSKVAICKCSRPLETSECKSFGNSSVIPIMSTRKNRPLVLTLQTNRLFRNPRN